jgi:hypothetical protein
VLKNKLSLTCLTLYKQSKSALFHINSPYLSYRFVHISLGAIRLKLYYPGSANKTFSASIVDKTASYLHVGYYGDYSAVLKSVCVIYALVFHLRCIDCHMHARRDCFDLFDSDDKCLFVIIRRYIQSPAPSCLVPRVHLYEKLLGP